MSHTHVLVIDDHELFLNGMVTLLRSFGYSVHSCDSGEAGLEMLTENEFDVVIIDFRLPGMTGLDVVDAMQSDPKLSRVPAIIFSGSDISEEACLRAGASSFLQKPIGCDALHSTIERVVAPNMLTQEISVT